MSPLRNLEIFRKLMRLYLTKRKGKSMIYMDLMDLSFLQLLRLVLISLMLTTSSKCFLVQMVLTINLTILSLVTILNQLDLQAIHQELIRVILQQELLARHTFDTHNHQPQGEQHIQPAQVQTELLIQQVRFQVVELLMHLLIILHMQNMLKEDLVAFSVEQG